MDHNSLGTGFMTVFAVSGSVVLVAMQVQKRLLSNFMEKMETEFKKSSGIMKPVDPKKKVRFAVKLVESTAHKRSCGKKSASRAQINNENFDGMPRNWQVMYKGILEDRNLRASSSSFVDSDRVLPILPHG